MVAGPGQPTSNHPRFSMILRSGDWDGRSTTFSVLLLGAGAVETPGPSGNSTLGQIILTNLPMVSEIQATLTLTKVASPAQAPQPHSMMKPPPHFPGGNKCFSCSAGFFPAVHMSSCYDQRTPFCFIGPQHQSEAGSSKCAPSCLKRLRL